MASHKGPPARNTRAAHRSQTHEVQSVPSREEQGGNRVPSEISAPREESVLSSIAESRSDTSYQPEGVIPGGNAPSKQGTVRERSEEPCKQSFTTAAGSFGPFSAPVGFSAALSEVPLDRGRGRMPGGDNERWDNLLEEMKVWSAVARRCQADADQLQANSSDVVDAMQRMQKVVGELRPHEGGRTSPEQSPRALASRALYANRGSTEGTAEYQRCKDAQARFETPQPSTRIEEVTSRYSSSPYTGTEDQSTQRCARQMAALRARAAWNKPQGRTSGPPPRNRGRYHKGSDEEPSNPSSDEGLNYDQRPREMWIPHDQAETDAGYADPVALTGPTHNTLEQDYACRSISAQPQQTIGPMVLQRQSQRQQPEPWHQPNPIMKSS